MKKQWCSETGNPRAASLMLNVVIRVFECAYIFRILQILSLSLFFLN